MSSFCSSSSCCYVTFAGGGQVVFSGPPGASNLRLGGVEGFRAQELKVVSVGGAEGGGGGGWGLYGLGFMA